MKTVAVIGCGALAHAFAEAAALHLSEAYRITGFLGKTPAHTEAIAAQYHAAAFSALSQLLQTQPDYVVELAGVAAARDYSESILRTGCNLVLASIGALAQPDFFTALENAARSGRAKLYLISGAVGGFDVLQTISMMGPVRASIDNEKPPENLAGAPYLETHPLDSAQPQTVFTGPVQEAIAGFPKNVNVAVAASLAAQAPEMQVVIRSTPGITDNRHTIRAENDSACAELTITSRPDPQNPRSSTIAAWSAAALLKNLASPVVFF